MLTSSRSKSFSTGTDYLSSLQSDQQTIHCGTGGSTCGWLFREALRLDVADGEAMGDFCQRGLHRVGLYSEIMHSEQANQRLAHLDCFAGSAAARRTRFEGLEGSKDIKR